MPQVNLLQLMATNSLYALTLVHQVRQVKLVNLPTTWPRSSRPRAKPLSLPLAVASDGACQHEMTVTSR